MKSVLSKICFKLGNPFNVKGIRYLNKEQFSRTLFNFRNVQKPHNKNGKLNLYLRADKYVSPYKTDKKIGFLEYCLLSIPIATFVLGTWQVQRLRWKLNLIETLKSHITQEPIELPKNLENLESKEYYPIKVKGTFLYDKEFLVGLRSLLVTGKPIESDLGILESRKGYHVLTPFKLTDRDETILVNRGWIPASLKNPAMRQQNQIKGETEVVGILRLDERRPPFVPKNRSHSDIWYYRDLNAMAERADVSPIYIEMLSNNNQDEYPIGNQTRVDLRNEHLTYIITWYLLSGMTAYMWYWKCIKRLPFAY